MAPGCRPGRGQDGHPGLRRLRQGVPGALPGPRRGGEGAAPAGRRGGRGGPGGGDRGVDGRAPAPQRRRNPGIPHPADLPRHPPLQRGPGRLPQGPRLEPCPGAAPPRRCRPGRPRAARRRHRARGSQAGERAGRPGAGGSRRPRGGQDRGLRARQVADPGPRGPGHRVRVRRVRGVLAAVRIAGAAAGGWHRTRVRRLVVRNALLRHPLRGHGAVRGPEPRRRHVPRRAGHPPQSIAPLRRLGAGPVDLQEGKAGAAFRRRRRRAAADHVGCCGGGRARRGRGAVRGSFGNGRTGADLFCFGKCAVVCYEICRMNNS